MDSVWFPPNASNFTFDWFQTTKNTRRDEFDMLVFLGDMAYNLEA
jgi:phosphodiesterase/alkaline phosphatase D-like protein